MAAVKSDRPAVSSNVNGDREKLICTVVKVKSWTPGDGVPYCTDLAVYTRVLNVFGFFPSLSGIHIGK